MLIPSLDAFKNGIIHFSIITFHASTLELRSLSWNPSGAVRPGSFPNQLCPCPLCDYTTQGLSTFIRCSECGKNTFTSGADRFTSGHVFQLNTSNLRIPNWGTHRFFLISKRCQLCLSAHAHAGTSISTLQESGANSLRQLSTLLQPQCIPVRFPFQPPRRSGCDRHETNSFCMCRLPTLLEVDHHISNKVSVFKFCVLNLAFSVEPKSTLITFFTSAFINVPYWMLP